ncbi:LYSM-DOMAIN RECEPTOR-LIKE KINASE [Salix purpurea]|uniref:LYSM-DOMAIN RECEPTOR-LIKE KINASE n=1 Tax=Salix purpurea TaxID=77065 RepID=A0A9Q0PNK3_SALPP|nr:LYSM-DOMAIN RECEPTOR-LIKE KINASE [Salix purpurea]
MYLIWFAAETMFFICFQIFLFFNPPSSQQYYDPSDCSENTSYPGSRYTCNHSYRHSCQTFLVYRANQYFKTISDVSKLLQVDPAELLRLNNLKSQLKVLEPGREVLVPIKFSCLGQFKQCIAFLGRKTTEGGCFDGLRSLKEDYPLPEALCLAVLAKACVEEDPLHRPSLDDILKVLVRMVR